MENVPLNIIIDTHIPYIKGVLEPYAQSIRYLEPSAIDAAAMADAHCLITRTRTRVDAALLDGSPCRMVATATIGTDHIDLAYCHSHGITVANAPGCNAPAVAQYVLSSVLALANRPMAQHTIGIVGVGHVGRIVERWARALSMNVMCCDPPRAAAGDPGAWYNLDDIAARADVITFHTPLTRDGAYPTWHMCDATFVRSLRRAPIVINAARGPVADTSAILQGLRDGHIRAAVIDTWEDEPNINRELLEHASIATPHIAGYSREGKARATAMVLNAVCHFFRLPQLLPIGAPVIPAEDLRPGAAPMPADLRQGAVRLLQDTACLRANPDNFEILRSAYDLRPEPRLTIAN